MEHNKNIYIHTYNRTFEALLMLLCKISEAHVCVVYLRCSHKRALPFYEGHSFT